MTTGDRAVDPYVGFRFRVEIDALTVAGFTEVGGLEAELETEQYEEGGVNDFTHQLPTRFSYPNLTVKRGLTDSRDFSTWIERAMHGDVRREDGRIVLLGPDGEDVRAWSFTDGYPVKWVGPDLSATEGAVAFETLEIAHHGLEVER